MKLNIIIFILFILYFWNFDNRKISIPSVPSDSIAVDLKNSVKKTEKFLNELIPSLKEFIKVDTSIIFYNNFETDEQYKPILVIGKFIDSTKIYAVDISVTDKLINFYYFDNIKWRLVGSKKLDIEVFKVEFEDLNGDNKNEIIATSFYNMNGNRWMEVYSRSSKTDSIKYAGNFTTNYKVNKSDKTIEVTYGGSWYMDQEKTLYQWNQDKLIPVKKAVHGLKEKIMTCTDYFIEYYENPTLDKDTLILKMRESYDEKNEKQKKLWDNFFDK